MAELSASLSSSVAQPNPQVQPPPRIQPPPDQPPPFIEPGRRDPRRIDDPPRMPDEEPPTEPMIKPPSPGMPFIEQSARRREPWHLLHYRALERRQARSPHLLRVDTWHPLGFRVVALRVHASR